MEQDTRNKTIIITNKAKNTHITIMSLLKKQIKASEIIMFKSKMTNQMRQYKDILREDSQKDKVILIGKTIMKILVEIRMETNKNIL